MKGKLVLLGMLIVFILALAFSQSQPAQAEVTETFVGLKGADIWDKPPGMGGSVVGHLPFLFEVRVYTCIGQEPNVWAKINQLFGYWVDAKDLDWKCGMIIWEPEG